MNTIQLSILGRSLACIACVAGATFLAYHGKEGWGWLIFLGLCVGCYDVTSSSNKEDKDDDE